jgi:hypothetical protein
MLATLVAPMLVTSVGAGLFMPFMNVFFRLQYRMPDGTIVTVMDGCTYAPWQDPFVEYPLMGCIYGIPILGGAKQMVVREAPGK